MSRDHDAPLEYLRILASLKLRFGLATLVTAHGALPVVYPIEEQGHSATQCLRGILTFPTVALVVKLPNERYGPSGCVTNEASGVFLRDVSQMRTNMIAVNANAVGFCILQ